FGRRDEHFLRPRPDRLRRCGGILEVAVRGCGFDGRFRTPGALQAAGRAKAWSSFMYVWGRLARMSLTATTRGRYRMGDESRLSFRCLPSDIDSNLHLNNARYMMLADVGRIDIFIRAGLLGHARRHGWVPMLGGLQTVYVREIRLWKRFDVVTTI